MRRSRAVPTPYGEGRLDLHAARDATATLLLSHGAGNGVESRDLVALAEALPGQGISVALFEQPWRVAGRRIATAPKTLDEAFVAAVDQLRVRTPLVVGGRSAGARSAARTARHLGASGYLALSFPLHPPGRPEKSRVEELLGVRVPALVIQGERDAMGRPEEFPDPLPDHVDLAVVPGADHGFAVLKRAEVTEADAMALLVEATLEWLVREVLPG